MKFYHPAESQLMELMEKNRLDLDVSMNTHWWIWTLSCVSSSEKDQLIRLKIDRAIQNFLCLVNFWTSYTSS